MRQQEKPKKEEIFPTRLKALRLRKGWTQEILAEKTGFSLSSIGNWEVRDPQKIIIPSPQKLGKLAEVLGVEIPYLLGEDSPTSAMVLHDHAPSATEILITFRTREPKAAQCINHFIEYLNSVGADPDRLSWLLIELRRLFPIAGAGYEQRGRATLKKDPGIDAAARDLLDEGSK